MQQSDTLPTTARATVNEPERYAIGHLESATTIQPDSALSYIVLASTQFNQGNTPQAIETYEIAMERMEVPEVDDYEFLISLYLDQEEYDKASDMTNGPGKIILIILSLFSSWPISTSSRVILTKPFLLIEDLIEESLTIHNITGCLVHRSTKM